MPEIKKFTALDLQAPNPLSESVEKYFNICLEKLGVIPNVLHAYSFDEDKLNAFSGLYNNIMLGKSGLSKLDREMIAVVVSSVNKCFYCLVAHGASVRELSKNPILGEALVMNYRSADLENRERKMLDFAVKITENSSRITENDREELRQIGFSDKDIWDISAVSSFFNMSNRMASAVDMRPNDEYHKANR